MTNSFSLTPLLRSTVGFDRFSDLFESLMAGEDTGSAYPPYNIEKHAEDRYGITMAVAGFNEKDLNITVQSDRVTVCGRREQTGETVEYLYRGIALRAFERTFRLADSMKVTGAEMKDGLLKIELVREIPEEQKPRTIPIKNAGSAKVIDHAAAHEHKDKKKIT